jgi:carbonic anhydrase/acetyltransferase-like protein (isoleucine patch superfamily)
MLIRHRDSVPQVDDSVYVAPNATLVGNVHVGPDSRIMYNAVLDAEASRIDIGECTIVCENAVIRATAVGDVTHPVWVGDNVFVSPHATLLGCRVEAASYIASNATVLQGATVHTGAVVAVGALVHANAIIPADFFVPPYNIAIGDPVKLYSPDEKDALTDAIKAIGFIKTAFDVNPQWDDHLERYRRVTQTRSREFSAHFEDEILPD